MNSYERIHAPNPLLIPLGVYIEPGDWPDRLVNDPLYGVPFESLTFQDRDLLLAAIRTRHEPTEHGIDIATMLQTMIWTRYVEANPALPENRLKVMNVLGERGKAMTVVPWFPTYASALLICGCTGTGKTTIINRILRLYQQQYKHEANEETRWLSQLQIVFLVVPMPVYRGGLLYAILAAIDAAIGTSYRDMYSARRGWTIEKLAVEVGILLVQHFVGVLIIEEIQPSNFSMSPHFLDMLYFLLRLMNFGIPVVLIGNPLGFLGFDNLSQDLRRFTEGEPIHLMPPACDSCEWNDGLGPGIWSHNVMPDNTPWSPEISKALHAISGGLPGYISRATEGVQRIALRETGCSAVSLAHFEKYRTTSNSYQQNRDLIEGFANRDAKKLSRFVDIPWEQYGLAWGTLTAADIAAAEVGDGQAAGGASLSPEAVAAYSKVHLQTIVGFKSALTRSKNREERNRAARNSATGKDLRTGNSENMAQGLEALHDKLIKKKPASAAKD